MTRFSPRKLRNRRLAIGAVTARWQANDARAVERERDTRSEWAANRSLADVHERAGHQPASLEPAFRLED